MRWWAKISLLTLSPTLALFAVLGAGCAGYKLGPTNGLRAQARSVQVNQFINQTMELRLGEPVTQAVRKALQQDGTYRLATGGDGDIIVSGTITEFNRSVLSLQPNDLISVRDYTLSLSVHVKAIERGTGRVLLDKQLSGRTTVAVGADLPSAERQALPLLADDLARKIKSSLVDGEW